MGKVIQLTVVKTAIATINFHEYLFLSRCAILMPHPHKPPAIIYHAYYIVREQG
jgi:hypothetical protein